MKKLVRGGVILSLMGLFVVFMYAQAKTETALSIANDSQLKENITPTAAELRQDDKKLVKKTVISKAAGISKGSFSATAYCLKGKTALGHKVRPGLIAADPRILKLGSKIQLNAGPYSGSYLVSDTGGGINGRELDIWMASCSEARRFGRRTVTVSVPIQ